MSISRTGRPDQRRYLWVKPASRGSGPRIDELAGRGRLHDRRAGVFDVEAFRLHLTGERLPRGFAQAGEQELLADPGR